MIRLNAQGWTAREIAKIFLCHEHAVRAALHHWSEKGLAIFVAINARMQTPSMFISDIFISVAR